MVLSQPHQQHDPVQRVAADRFLDLHAGEVAEQHGVGPQRVLAQRHGRELERHAAGFPDAALHVLGQLAQRGVAGVELGPAVADADDRLAVEDMVRQAQLALHRPVQEAGLVDALEPGARTQLARRLAHRLPARSPLAPGSPPPARLAAGGGLTLNEADEQERVRADAWLRRRSTRASRAGRCWSPAAASGIGASLVEHFCAQGARVTFLDVQAEASAARSKRIERRGLPAPRFVQCDLRDVAALQAAVGRVEAEDGPVGRAGQQCRQRRPAPDRGRLGRLLGRAHGGQPAPPVLRRPGGAPADERLGGGSIVNFGSITWHVGEGGYPAYVTCQGGRRRA